MGTLAVTSAAVSCQQVIRFSRCLDPHLFFFFFPLFLPLVAIQLFVLQPSRVQPEVSPWEGGCSGGHLNFFNPCFLLTEPEGDAANHTAEGPLHPHRCRWSSPRSPWFFSASAWGADGENPCSLCCGQCWAVETHERQRRCIRVTRNGLLPSFISDARPDSFVGFHMGQRCLGHGDGLTGGRFVSVPSPFGLELPDRVGGRSDSPRPA